MLGLGLPGCPAGFWKAQVPGPSSGLWAARLPQILCPHEQPGRTSQSHQVLGQSSWWASHAGKNGKVCVSGYYCPIDDVSPHHRPPKTPGQEGQCRLSSGQGPGACGAPPSRSRSTSEAKADPAEWGVYFLTHQPASNAAEGVRVTRVRLPPGPGREFLWSRLLKKAFGWVSTRLCLKRRPSPSPAGRVGGPTCLTGSGCD